jgi:hypothetical protein
MCANSKVLFISGKNSLSNIAAVWKNALATTIVEIFSSNASLAVIRCLLSTVAVAVLFSSAAECQASAQRVQQQVNQRQGDQHGWPHTTTGSTQTLSNLRHDCQPPITKRPAKV